MKKIYERNYDLLYPILELLKDKEAIKLEAKGFMNLHIDNLGRWFRDGMVYSLAHYYEQNGDLVPDPDMEIAVYSNRKMVEALTYQDTYRYDEVYFTDEIGQDMVRPTLKKSLNDFLNLWLRNIRDQGFLGKVEKAATPLEQLYLIEGFGCDDRS